ncbi:hypothetical protein LRD69_16875 [Streptomyces sp. JH14]|uniref:hypothetical protein n=1 Tax=Streptomyces sp. JH14 TaxID=2793630 RepID=UPI0023F7FDB0|nr:hypothetical protein [Streptomyces sp. JH14]MDF6043774.1 hypothetical protein [Streptomyces sp. JH14]
MPEAGSYGRGAGSAGISLRDIIQEFVPPTDEIASIPHSGATLPAKYIHHCHLLEHEDDDLMRPWTIVRADDHGGGHSH